MRRALRSSWSLLLVLPLLSSSAAAAPTWPKSPLVNRAVCDAGGAQSLVRIAPDGAGGAIVAWRDRRAASDDIYAQRLGTTGAARWAANGVAVCAASGDQSNPVVVEDGAGGAFVVWQDPRGASIDIYAQRLDASGLPQWIADGVAVCAAANSQTTPVAVADGAGGVIVAWQDSRGATIDVYAQRLNAAGAAQWTANGVALCLATNTQNSLSIVADGAGGAIVVWQDSRTGTPDVYAQRVTGAGAPQWTADGVALCTAANGQTSPRAASDGAGGVVVAWSDARVPPSDIFAQRLNASGVAQWAADGVALCTAAGGQTLPAIVADGAGGAVVAWSDARGGTNDIYAQRVGPTGAAAWTAQGVAVCAAVNAQSDAAVASDGAGGAIVTWTDPRSGVDVYAQRVDAAGAAQWTLHGIPVSSASGTQSLPVLVADGRGGAILAWEDARSGLGDVYAQRIDGSGFLGNTEPVIERVRDVPDDQGGRVLVLWESSARDASPGLAIESYTLWRRITTTALPSAAAAFESGRPGPGSRRSRLEGGAATFWEFVATVPARGASGYGYTVSTHSDSMAGSPAYEVFFVDAYEPARSAFHVSAADSGYSVDNLSPAPPGGLVARYAPSQTRLHWQPSPEQDFGRYRIHRGGSPDFVPGPGTLIAEQSDTGYVDVGHGAAHYKISAVDVHGNESGFAAVSPSGTASVPPREAAGVGLVLASANPARGEALLRWTLPAAAEVRLTIHDVMGRVVRTLVAGLQAAGTREARWDGRDAAGAPVAAGVYRARIAGVGAAREVPFSLLR